MSEEVARLRHEVFDRDRGVVQVKADKAHK